MTYYEKVVLSAYTGMLLVDDFADVQRYIEEKLGRPTFTHELVNEKLCEEIKDKVRPDLLKICGIT